MHLLRWLCWLRWHAYRGDPDSVARRYQHNTWFDKSNNKLGSPRALTQTCRRCGKRRVWSFRRGTWRTAAESEASAVDTSAAYNVELPAAVTPTRAAGVKRAI